MKKISLIIMTLFCSLYSVAQQAPSNDVATFIVPKQAEKKTKDQFLSYARQNFKHSRVSEKEKDNYYKNSYIIDGILVSVSDQAVSEGFKKSLNDSKSEILEFLKLTKSLTVNYAKIITVNNMQFLVYETQQNDEVFLRFVSDFRNNKNVLGILQYKISDEEKAQKVLDTLLSSMHFKN